MSSPPSPSSSIKAAPLHVSFRKRHQRSSFPSVTIHNPFRKKLSPEPVRSPSPIEPYEVAPGIWNTDATAKVFGYLEHPERKDKVRSKNAIPDVRHPSNEVPNRKPVAEKASGKANDSIDAMAFAPQDPNDQSEPPHQRTPDQARMEIRAAARNWSGTRKERMKTVSRDDQLVQRGANPRTGLVSPFVTSDSSDESITRDYVTVGKIQWKERALPKGRTRSGKWKQHGVGWSLVESPLLSPIAQSVNDPVSRKVSVKQLEDKLLVEMPGVDNPEPRNMTDLQMRKYQDSIAQAYRHGGSAAMIEPGTLPSPRQSTPEGPSTPPNKLQRIRRKMVGSGPNRREDSNDTVVITERNRAPFVPTPRKASREQPAFPTATPSDAPKGQEGGSRGNHLDNRTIPAEDPFLGLSNERQAGQAPRITLLPSPKTPLPQGVCHRYLNRPESPSRADAVDPLASPTLSQCLPNLRLRHPSFFSPLTTSSYRRPERMLPQRLRPPDQKKKTTEDACIITTISTSSLRSRKGQRPKVQRQDESMLIPNATQLLPQIHEMPRETYLQAGTIRKKPIYGTKPTEDISESKTIRQHAIRLPEPTRAVKQYATARRHSKDSARCMAPKNKVSNSGAERGARVAMMEHHRSQLLRQDQLRRSHMIPVPMNHTSSFGNTNIIREPGQRKQRSGAGTTHTCGHLGDDGEGVNDGLPEHERSVGFGHETCGKPPTPTGIALQDDGQSWFAGQWARAPEDPDRPGSPIPEVQGIFTRSRPIVSDVKNSLQASTTISCIQRRLFQVACHVMQTLRPNSPALKILKKPNVEAQDYLRAVREVVLAFIYLVLLINVILAFRKMLLLSTVVVSGIWHPARSLLAVLKWCFVS